MLVVRIIFWTWFAISVAILIYRGVRRVTRRGDRLQTSGVGVTTEPAAAPAPSTTAVDPTPPAPTPAPSAGTPVAAAARSRSRATIASMASGIRMPCNLVPMLDATPRPGSAESVAFATAGHTPEQVHEAVTIELERLGFSVERLADGDLRATRGDAELRASLVPNPAAVARGGIPAYPSARPDTLVLELWRD